MKPPRRWFAVSSWCVALVFAATSPAMAQCPLPPVPCNTVTYPFPPGASEDCLQWVSRLDGQTYDEWIVVQTPSTTIPDPALLVLFRGEYGTRCWDNLPADAMARDNLFNAAAAQGWYTVTFDAAHYLVEQTMGGPELMDRTAAVIEHMLAKYPEIDPTRVYSFAFSRGGGDAMAYAARHMSEDEWGVSFASVWFQSPAPTISIIFTEAPGYQGLIQEALAIGSGTPSSHPFEFAAASAIELDKIGPAMWDYVDGRSLVHNLSHLPCKVTLGTDTNISITEPIAQIQDLISDVQLTHPQYFTGFQNVTVGFGHSLNNMTPAYAQSIIDYLDPFRLTFPDEARTFWADDRELFYFDVMRDTDDELGEIEWKLHAAPTNKIVLRETYNLESVTMDGPELTAKGLDMGQPVKLNVKTAGGGTLPPECDIAIANYGLNRPSSVWRILGNNHIIVYPNPGSVWSWRNRTVTIHDPGGGGLNRWRINP